LLLRLSEGEDARQLLEEKKGHYCKKLKGWLVDYRNLKISHFGSSGRWLSVEGEYAVFKPVRGLQISTTFMNLEDGQALCGVLVGDCGFLVYVEGMTEDQMEGLVHGQEIVVRLNVVTMGWQGQLVLMGYRIFEENNNDGDAVDEEGNSIQDQEVQIEMEEEQEGCEDSNTSISSLLKSDELEVEHEDGTAGSNLSKSKELVSISENLSGADDWCEDREKIWERSLEKSHLSPVVRLRKLDDRRINFWAEIDIEEEQNYGNGSESGGSILKKGLKFSSADDYLSFMEEDRPEVEAALQPSVVEMNYVYDEAGLGEEQGNRKEDGSLEKEAEDEGSPSNRVVKGSSGTEWE